MALGIAETPLHGPEIDGSGKDVHARIAAATLAGWMKIQRLYAKHATRAWITGLLGEPGAALANGVMPVERSEPGVAGFRDYARNDEVEDLTLYGEYRDVTLRASSCHARAFPCHARTFLCHARTFLCHTAHTPVMLRVVAASRK